MQGIDIFDASLDGGNLSEFDTASGSVAVVSAAAARAGTRYGLAFDASQGTNVSYQKTISWGTDVVRMRLHFDQQDLVPFDTAARTVLRLTEAGVAVRFQIVIRDASGGSGSLEASVIVSTDVGSSQTGWYAFGTGDHWLEARMVRATTSSDADGSITLWIDGAEQETLSGLDIFDVGRPDRADVTWIGAHASDTGGFYGDEYIVRNEDVEIGQVELTHVLAKAGVEDGTSDDFDTFGGGGGVSVEAAAAMAGSRHGVEFTLGSASVSNATANFPRVWTSRTIRYRFHFDPNSCTLADTNLRRIADLATSGVGARSEALLYSDGGGGYEVSARVTLDAGSSETAHYAITDGEHHIEVVVRRSMSSSAADGELELWIDDVLKEQKTGLDIWDVSRPDLARFLWGSGSVSDSGTVYSDELEVRDTDAMIGSAVDPLRGVLSITVGGSAVDYIPRTGERNNQLGATAGTFVFETRDAVAEEENVIVNREWKDEAGNTNRTEKIFQGKVTEVNAKEIGVSGVYESRVLCADHRYEAGFTFITKKIQRKASEDVYTTIDNKLPGAFSLDVEDGPDVGPYDLQDQPAPQFAADVARDAGQIMWIDPDKVIRSVAPDSIDGSHEINRVSGGRYNQLDYRRNVGKVANRIIVRGDDGKAVTVDNEASQDRYGVRPMVFSAHGVKNVDTLTTIANELAESHKIPIVEGSVATRFDRITVGDNIRITDLGLRLRRFNVRVTQVSEQQLSSHEWEQTVSFTSERVLPNLIPPNPAVDLPTIQRRGPDLKPAAPVRSEPPRVVHRAPVQGPDSAQTAGASEYIGQLRMNEATGVVRLTLDSTHGAPVDQGFRILISARGTVTAGTSLFGTSGSEGVSVVGSGTKLVSVVSTLSGDEDRWQLNNEVKRVNLTLTGDYEEAEIKVALWDGDVGGGLDDVMDAFYVGTTLVQSNVDIRRDAIFDFRFKPQVASGEISDLDADKVNEDADRGFVDPDYTDVSRRPTKQRRAVGGVDVDADDVFDTTREDTTDVTEAGNIEFVNGTTTDASRRVITIRRNTGASDIDADDITEYFEVEENLGGVGNIQIRDAVLATELIDRTNEECQNMHLLNNCEMGNPDGSEEQTNVVRAGGNRGLEVIDSQFRLTAKITEGFTAAREGASTWGVQWNGDGSTLEADAGTGESGDGSGDSGGGDIDP